MEKPWKVIVAFVGVFIAGSIFGGLLALRLSKRDLPPRFAQVPVNQPQFLPPPQGQPQTPPAQSQPQPQGPRPNALPPQPLFPPNMAVQAPQLMRRYVDRLDLTPEQRERVNPLIVRAANDLRRQQQTNLRETGIIIQHLQEDISKELTPAQRGLLEEMAERQRKLIEQRERQQQEQARQQQLEKQEKRQQGQKPPLKDGVKPKLPSGKPPEDGN